MPSLRTFPFGFLLAFVAADLFGTWAIWSYRESRDVGLLILGISVILGGLGLIAYAVHLVRMLDRASIVWPGSAPGGNVARPGPPRCSRRRPCPSSF